MEPVLIAGVDDNIEEIKRKSMGIRVITRDDVESYVQSIRDKLNTVNIVKIEVSSDIHDGSGDTRIIAQDNNISGQLVGKTEHR